MRAGVAAFGLVGVLGAGLGLRLAYQASAASGPAGGAGTVEGEPRIVSARVGGRVVTVHVAEGAAVEAGAALMTLDCLDAEAARDEAAARLAAAKAQADAAAGTATATRRTADVARQQAAASSAQAAAVAAQQAQAERTAARLAALGEDVAADRREAAQTAATGLAAQHTGAAASAGAVAAQLRVSDAQGSAATASARAASETVHALQAGYDRALRNVEECVVRSPIAGRVETLPWHAGELVGPGVPLARVIDLTDLTVTFYLPNAEIGAVSPGAPVDVVADAFPDETFAATIETIALRAEFTPRNIQTRTDRDRLVFPVQVRLNNADERLRPGMPVDVRLADEGR